MELLQDRPGSFLVGIAQRLGEAGEELARIDGRRRDFRGGLGGVQFGDLGRQVRRSGGRRSFGHGGIWSGLASKT